MESGEDTPPEHERTYRCVAASVEGFIQQVAVSYIRTGHFFYVPGRIKPEVDPPFVDDKVIRRYEVNVSRWTRSLRKQRGEANLQYIRHDRFFLIMATHGTGRFFELEGEQVLDCRRIPIKFHGYSLSYRGGHPHVRLSLDEYSKFKAAMLEVACRLGRAELEQVLGMPRYAPYAPVRRQLWNVWREVNRARVSAGLEPVSQECLSLRRRIVRPFGDPRWAAAPSPSERSLAASVEIVQQPHEPDEVFHPAKGETPMNDDDKFERLTGPETYRTGLTYQGPSTPPEGREPGVDLNVPLFDASGLERGQGVLPEATPSLKASEHERNRSSERAEESGPMFAGLSLQENRTGVPVLPKEWEDAHKPASKRSADELRESGDGPGPDGPPHRPRGLPR